MMPILIVDDSREDLLLTDRILQQCRIQNPVKSFSDGRKFLEHIRQHSKPENTPSLVLLDLIMQPVSGLEILSQLNEEGLTVDHFVVMMSGLGDLKEIREGYQLGARTFLLKPISTDEMLDMLRTLRDAELVAIGNGYALKPLPKAQQQNPDAERLHARSFVFPGIVPTLQSCG